MDLHGDSAELRSHGAQLRNAAELDAKRSQQPRLPHGHRGPFSSNVT